jgi:hypothetical protein
MKLGARVLELLATPGRCDIQGCVIRDSAGFDSAQAQAPRIVIVYQSSSGVRRALKLAQHLALGDTAVWIVCLLTNSPFGHFRFIRFVNLVGRLMNETSITGLRISFLAVPCPPWRGLIDSFLTARSIVLTESQWWRPGGSVRTPSFRTAHHFMTV